MTENEEVTMTPETLPAQTQPMEMQPTEQSAQIDTIIRLSQFAMQRPRNEPQALIKTLQRVDESSWWTIPNRGNGVSVNIARTAIQSYGNCAVLPNYADILMPDGQPGWRLSVLAIDMQSLCVQMSSGNIHKPKRKLGEKYQAYQQRLFQTQLSYGGRLERNATMKILPGHWKDQIKKTFLGLQSGLKLEQRIPIIVKKLKDNYDITEGDIKKLIGADPAKMSEAQFGELRGIYNALFNGDVVKDELLGDGKGSDPPSGKKKPGKKKEAEPPEQEQEEQQSEVDFSKETDQQE